MLLLHLFVCLFPNRVRAIYVDHQLQEQSGVWGEVVKQYSDHQHIECVICPVWVEQGNLESEARNSRYLAFRNHIQSNEVLVLAHHQQDQAETVLLRLLSGTGVTGLGAMNSIDIRDDLVVWRPFLSLTREYIEEWAKQIDLPFVVDPTNADTHYDRAWARAELWPTLTARFPKMQTAIARTALLMQDAEDILLEVVYADLKQCISNQTLDLACFSQLSEARQRQLLSKWMMGDELYRPSFKLVDQLFNDVIHARLDAQSQLFCKPYWYTRFQGKIYQLTADEYLAQKKDSIDSKRIVSFSLDQSVELIQGVFMAKKQKKIGLSDTLLNQPLCLVIREGGEKIHFHGRVGRWPLKKAIQNAHIFPWLRHRVQILQLDNAILGVFTPHGFWLAQSEYCQQDGWLPELCIS